MVVGHFDYEGNAFGTGTQISDLTLEDITVYGSPGMGFFFAGTRGFRLSHCRIMQRPGTNRPVSTTGNGSMFLDTLGDILIEDCDFSGQADDAVDLTSPWFRVMQKANARTVVLTKQIPNIVVFYAIRTGSVLKAVKPDSLAEYARINVTKVTFESGTGRYTVTVDQDLPVSLAVNDFVINLTQSNHKFLLRRNYFHDHRGRGMVIESPDGVVENNRVKNTTYQSLQLFAETVFFGVGPGAENVIVRNNSFDGCGYGNFGTAGATMGCVGISAQTSEGVASSPTNKNILFEGNTISRTPGLGLFISSASGITVSNNVIINSNTLGAFPPWYGSAIGVIPHGSIMVTKASNVLLTNNLQLFSSQQVEKGIHSNAQDTTNVTVQNNFEDLSPTNPLDSALFFVRQHYIDFLSRYPDTGGWGYWGNQISQCGADADCIRKRRVGVSAAFFVELEFQRTGSFVYRLYKGGLARRPTYQEFNTDRAQIVEGLTLETDKHALALNHVQRSEFLQKYVGQVTADSFVDALIASILTIVEFKLKQPTLRPHRQVQHWR